MDWQKRRKLATMAAIEAERTRLFAKVPHAAPIDPIDVAIKCGCEVRFLSLASLEGVYSPEPRPTIVLGAERPAGRRTYTCAHELGHHVFKHGMSIENLETQRPTSDPSSEEFIADVFAGYILMSQTAVFRTLKDRGWSAASLQPDQVYRLANYFGVGYGTITNHLASSLRIISREYANELLKSKPKQIKTAFGACDNSEVLLVDYNWKHRTIELEAGDTLVLPQDAKVESNSRLRSVTDKNDRAIFKANTPGYSRAFCQERAWAVNIRISRKNYEGLAQYRFLEESEAVE